MQDRKGRERCEIGLRGEKLLDARTKGILTKCYRTKALAKVHEQHEKEKRMEVENASFMRLLILWRHEQRMKYVLHTAVGEAWGKAEHLYK